MQGILFASISTNRIKTLRRLCLIVFVYVTLAGSFVSANTQPKELRYVLEALPLPMMHEVSKVYRLRDYALIWSDGISYNEHAHLLLQVIKNARKLGLNPADYDEEIIQYFLETRIDDTRILSKSDVTFTHAYMRLAANIDQNKYSTGYDLSTNFGLLGNPAFLEELIGSEIIGENSKDEFEKSSNSQPILGQNYYLRLLRALEKYRSFSENFEPIFLQQKSYTLGDVSPEIGIARKRLHELGDYNSTDLQNEIFDETLAMAVSDFQIRHGLKVDGILGKRTVREINTSIQTRIEQLEINLERAKQLAEINDERYILVNVPEYKLHVIENGEPIYNTRVIVGKKKNKTPVLSSVISEFVLNPYWNVPKSITKNEIIPKVQEDPEYLIKNNMKVISRLNDRNYFLDPTEIDWMNIDVDNAPLRIRQDPGSVNALGRIKFVFPNNYKVYLHDTPSRRLFARSTRALSHGCVRVEKPLKLAEVLLDGSLTWTPEALHHHAKRKKTRIIKLDRPIPVHITYMTAWVDHHGITNFRPDIYKRDSHIASTLYNASH